MLSGVHTYVHVTLETDEEFFLCAIFGPQMKMVDNSKLCDFGESKEKKVIFYCEISVKSNTICLLYQETPADGGSLKLKIESASQNK